MLWPIIVFFGLGFLISLYSDILLVIHYFAAAILAIMGLQIILKRSYILVENTRLTKSGFVAGFSAGFIAITANPKASLFYLTLLPGFFDFSKINLFDLAIISVTSFSVPMIGNLFLIFSLERVRFFLSSAKAIRTTNLVSGISLIIVGIVIAFN
tara:strand:+ start:114 stop:578 length:465 start_codon:yes stop_codon:yes gene_type:complete